MACIEAVARLGSVPWSRLWWRIVAEGRTRAKRSGEHVDGEAGFGVGDALLAGTAVGHGQQATDAARDGVLGQRRVRELAELLQAGLPVRHPQLARHGQVL